MPTPIITIKEEEVYMEVDELSIVSYLSYGFTAQQVSDKMKINVRTIESKIAKLKRELNCKTVTQLCCFCIRYKLIK